eukprot:1790122-Alexandrium_andersonii.AAC.1
MRAQQRNHPQAICPTGRARGTPRRRYLSQRCRRRCPCPRARCRSWPSAPHPGALLPLLLRPCAGYPAP